MADEDEGWARLARNLKAEIDPDLIEAYRRTVSLPFEPGNTNASQSKSSTTEESKASRSSR